MNPDGSPPEKGPSPTDELIHTIQPVKLTTLLKERSFQGPIGASSGSELKKEPKKDLMFVVFTH